MHSNNVGPLMPSFPDRFQYASRFVDDHSRYDIFEFMLHRSEIGEVFLGVKQTLKHLVGEHVRIRTLHSGNAEEYIALQSNDKTVYRRYHFLLRTNDNAMYLRSALPEPCWKLAELYSFKPSSLTFCGSTH